MRWVVALIAVVGCAFEPVDLEGRQCPCAPGYECGTGNVCVSSSDCTPLVTASEFRRRWETANVVWWDWTPAGAREDFVRYEVHVAERMEDLGTAAARVYDRDDNPELGGYVLQRTGGAEDLVTSTMTRDLDPLTTYYGQLVITDTAGCAFRSPPALADTTLAPPPGAEIVIFDDAQIGSSFPDTVVVADDADGSGRHLEHVPDRDVECVMSGDSVCSQNLRQINLGLSLADISEGEFAESAFVEVWIASDSAVDAFFCRVWLSFEGAGIHRIEPFTIPARDTYQVMQFPLRELVADAGGDLVHATATTDTLIGFNLGGMWSRQNAGGEATTVRLDEIRIRY